MTGGLVFQKSARPDPAFVLTSQKRTTCGSSKKGLAKDLARAGAFSKNPCQLPADRKNRVWFVNPGGKGTSFGSGSSTKENSWLWNPVSMDMGSSSRSQCFVVLSLAILRFA